MKEKVEAAISYDDGISKGSESVLLEQQQANMFSLYIGNLEPKMGILIRMKCICDKFYLADITDFVVLTLQDGMMKFQLRNIITEKLSNTSRYAAIIIIDYLIPLAHHLSST